MISKFPVLGIETEIQKYLVNTDLPLAIFLFRVTTSTLALSLPLPLPSLSLDFHSIQCIHAMRT